MRRPLANSYWVVPGRLLAGEYPHAGSGSSGADSGPPRLERLLDAGIDVFLDLTQPGERPEYQSLLPAGVDYIRSPIDDGAVPAAVTQMRDIQAHLRQYLEQGRRIYVHCRAGIGRTGTVIGCYLAEQSLDGQKALRRLNELWRQSARSASWPQVPQTDIQSRFILLWPEYRIAGGEQLSWAQDSAVDGPSLASLRTLRNRFLGCCVGMAVGDALGSSNQHRRPGSFAPIKELGGGGPFDLPRGAWSDDTALALCLSESLVECQRFDQPDQQQRAIRWQREGYLSAQGQCVGITAATARALSAPAGDRPATASVTYAEAAPLGRMAPLALFYLGQPQQALTAAEALARSLYASPLVIDCCRAQLKMLLAALAGDPIAQVLKVAASNAGAVPLLPEVRRCLELDPSTPPPAMTEPALTVLAHVRWALASGGSFRAGALLAANCGGDCDVIGAAYGQVAGAHFGIGGIPASWRQILARQELIEDLSDRLLTAALVQSDSDGSTAPG